MISHQLVKILGNSDNPYDRNYFKGTKIQNKIHYRGQMVVKNSKSLAYICDTHYDV